MTHRGWKKNPVMRTVGREIRSGARAVATEVRHLGWKMRRQSLIDRYLEGNAVRKLQIGCGPMVMDGWLNTDMQPLHERGVVYLDIREQLPLPNASFDYIYSEHVIEHVDLDVGIEHLKDCFRILRPGGVIRIATPDLQFLLKYFSSEVHTDVQQAFLDDIVGQFHPGLPLRSPAILLNEFVRKWGHLFVYDQVLLTRVLEMIGFVDVVSCAVKESRHAALNRLEQHGNAISDRFNELQTMVIEGTRGK